MTKENSETQYSTDYMVNTHTHTKRAIKIQFECHQFSSVRTGSLHSPRSNDTNTLAHVKSLSILQTKIRNDKIIVYDSNRTYKRVERKFWRWHSCLVFVPNFRLLTHVFKLPRKKSTYTFQHSDHNHREKYYYFIKFVVEIHSTVSIRFMFDVAIIKITFT